jgi:hypothetical protein
MGVRWLAETLAREYREQWIDQLATRKGYTGRHQAYWKYSVFKELEAGQPQYRLCSAGSPASHLAECWLISRLSELTSFQRHPCVYSYLWPSQREATHLFSHFISGYRWRERKVEEALERADDGIAVVLDLKGFYPSVNTTMLRHQFSSLLDNSGLSVTERSSAEIVARDLLSIPRVKGLPVGPPLSHVLANVFLRSVDDAMQAR